MSLGLLVIPTLIVIPIAIQVSKQKHKVIASAITALELTWLFTIAHVAWCVAYLLAASYAPGFNGTTYSGTLPASWQSFLNAASNPLYEVLLTLATILTLSVVATGRLNASEKFVTNSCNHCGYNLQGINSPICPECGHHTSM